MEKARLWKSIGMEERKWDSRFYQPNISNGVICFVAEATNGTLTICAKAKRSANF